jgi:3-oxo-5alpha-steroid 4-dehydrogenase
MLSRLKYFYRSIASGEAEIWSALTIPEANLDSIAWDASTDVAVIGFGGAGAVAAIEASEHGAQVTLLDRFCGGGSTKISGGIVYAGGGTRIQRMAGVEDSPDNMFNYLRQETGDAVKEETLRRFCNESGANFDWLEAQGVPFNASTCPFKTSYPSNRYYFYYSGNESFPPYSEHAKPAARGHRAHGPGVSGAALFDPLRKAVMNNGIKVLLQHKVVRLLKTENGRIVGLDCLVMEKGTVSAWLHKQLSALMIFLRYMTIYAAWVNYLIRWIIEKLERDHSKQFRLQARNGIVISSGGFYANRNMVERHAPDYLSGVPLGTIGDDGSGILLGESAGGSTGLMDSISAWRFINPPQAFVKGILVDQHGARICNEMLYGAQLAERIMTKAGGKAWLIIDGALFKQAWKELGSSRAMWFQSVSALVFMYIARCKNASLEGLACKLGMPALALTRTIEDYNRQARSGEVDGLGKPQEFFKPLGEGPYYALDCSADSLMACPTLSLGGLRVNEATGEVLDGSDTPVRGLYAAGRSAVGVASRSYVSGLSIADCIFSGRRAGRNAATADDT